jgi:drug/metabolite transporter (DMT)-like permease
VRRLKPYAIDIGLVFVVVVWGFSPNVFKFALSELSPLAFVFVRFALLCVVSILALAWRGARGGSAWRVRWRDWPLLIVSGLCGYGIYQLFYMVGLAHTRIFDSSLLSATVPVWTAMVLVALRLDRVSWLQWVGIVISLGGVAWFLLEAQSANPGSTPGPTPGSTPGAPLTPTDILFGNALTLVAALLFAIYGIVNRPLGVRYSPPELMCYTLIIGTLALAPFGIPAVLAQDWSHVSLRVWLIIPYSVIFPIYLTYSLWNWAIARRGPAYVSVYSYAVPVLAGVISVFIFGDSFSVGQIAGAGIVLLGMLLARWGAVRVARRARRERTAEAEPAQTAA